MKLLKVLGVFLFNLFLSNKYGVPGSDNPDIYLAAPGMIRRHGYISETHTVLTSDGYMLDIHRIPRAIREQRRKSKKPIVFLQHGLVSSSVHWLLPGPKNSLAYRLVDAGYDVWLGNFRGNEYGAQHISLNTHTQAFWNICWDDLIQRDMPAMIDHILNVTGQANLTYIGHSLGAGAGLLMMAEYPRYKKKINFLVGLAPAFYIPNVIALIRIAFINMSLLQDLYRAFLGENVLEPNQLTRVVNTKICSTSRGMEKICKAGLFIIGGLDMWAIKDSLVPVIEAHFPSTTGAGVAIQLGQEITAGGIGKYDYGAKKNLELYNSTIPPNYQLANIQTKVALFYSKYDWLINYKDLEKISITIPKVVEMYKIPHKHFSHFDYLFATNAPTLVYDEIFRLLKHYVPISPNLKENK